MKILKALSIIVFMVSVILFGGYMLKERTGNDPTGPVISVEQDHIVVSVKDGREALLAGVTAADARDGDISDAVCVEGISPFNEEGNRTVRYVVFDSDGHIAHALRTMSYTDYTAPVFAMAKDLAFPVGAANMLEGVTAQDCIDGDLSGQIQILFDDKTDLTASGIYPARLRVTNSAGGSSELPVSIELYNASAHDRLPVLNLSGHLAYLKKGEKFSAADYLKSAVINGAEYTFVKENGSYGSTEENHAPGEYTIDQSLAVISGEVDSNTAGCYEVTYSLKDGVFGTGTGTSRLYVVVTEGGAE